MITITNKYNLPEQLVKACLHDTHKVAGNISCSQLIDAPRIRLLKKQHDYEEDISERMFALMGTAMHNILERANISSHERRAFMMTAETIIRRANDVADKNKQDQLFRAAKYIQALIPVFFPDLEDRYVFEETLQLDVNGTALYGTFDVFDKLTGILYDYKVCSVYAWLFPESQKKWKAQTNVYAYLLQNNGYDVKEIHIVAFFRDWSETAKLSNKNYPAQQTMEIPIELRSMVEIGNYIKSRIDKHKEAESGNLPLCTGTERWAKVDQFAAKTPTSKRALRVFDNRALCKQFIAENSHKYKGIFLEFRPGESLRCMKFCPVAQFCDQRERELKLRTENADKE